MPDQLTTTPRQRHSFGLADRLVEPLSRMRSGVDHLIEDLPARLSAFQFNGAPAVEMIESDNDYSIAVEVPGIPIEDIDLQVDRDMLILKGERRDEREEKDSDYVISERSYGSFERRITLPADAVVDEIRAEAADGVLHISIPRSADAADQRQRIEIHSKRGKSD